MKYTYTSQELQAIPQVTKDYESHKELLYTAVLHTDAKKMLETGTDVGDSARIFYAALEKTGGSLISVDIKPVPPELAQSMPKANFAVGNTKDLKIKELLDLLYLDDHPTDDPKIREHVLSELERFGTWVRVGGIIIVHDTIHLELGPGITEAIRMFCSKYRLRWTEDCSGYGMATLEVTHELPHPVS